MRIHIDRTAMQIMRRSEDVRKFIASLAVEPRSTWALPVLDHPNEYELPIAGIWVRWQIDHTGSETVIRVTVLE